MTTWGRRNDEAAGRRVLPFSSAPGGFETRLYGDRWCGLVGRVVRRTGCRRVADRSGDKPRATLTALVVPGFAIDIFPRGVSAWILAPYRGTGHAFDRGNDELGAPE